MKRVAVPLVVLVFAGCAHVQPTNIGSRYCDVTSAKVVSHEGRQFISVKGSIFHGSALSVKKTILTNREGVAEIQLISGVVEPGESNRFEVQMPYDDSLREIWIGTPRILVWTRAKGMVFEKRKPVKLPPFEKPKP